MSKEHCKITRNSCEQNDLINTDQTFYTTLICKKLNSITEEIVRNRDILSNRDITLTKLIQKQGIYLEKASEKSDLFQIFETQKEILKILTQNKTEQSLNLCLKRIQDLLSLDIDKTLKNIENKLDFLSEKQDSPILKEVVKKIDLVLTNQGNYPTTDLLTKIADQLLKVQSETIPLIEQIKPILETIKKKL